MWRLAEDMLKDQTRSLNTKKLSDNTKTLSKEFKPFLKVKDSKLLPCRYTKMLSAYTCKSKREEKGRN